MLEVSCLSVVCVSEEIHVGSTAHSGVQFYVHEPRTREEDGICEFHSFFEICRVLCVASCVNCTSVFLSVQRRKALELEVKRNEKIQSQQNVSSLIDRINTIKVYVRACASILYL